MTARDAGGITAKALAVYAAISSMEYVIRTIDLISYYIKYHDWSNWSRSIAVESLSAALYASVALMLWARAGNFWSSDESATSEMNVRGWQRLALFIIGAYFFLIAAPEGLYLFATSLQTNLGLPKARPDDAWRAVGHLVIGAVLVATNWPKSAVMQDQTDPAAPG